MISEALRLIRVFHDLKQNELAEKLSLSKSFVSELESGKKIPSIDVLNKYSEHFKIPVSSIMFFSEKINDSGDINTNYIAEKILKFLSFIEVKAKS